MINELLEELRSEIISKKDLESKYLQSRGNANGFECLVRDQIVKEFNAKMKSKYANHTISLKPRFGKYFPDLDLYIDKDLYGIELKSRQDGSWKTLGGSVIESSSDNPYIEIYIVFASFNKKKHETSYHVRYIPYWKAANAIRVTHSPRFNIDLDNTNPIFTSNDDYKHLRSMSRPEKNQFIQRILALTVSKPTWYMNTDQTIKPTFFSDLSRSHKHRLIAEVLLLFPEDLLKAKKSNYNRVTQYLLSEYFVVSPSLRDNFTASGQLNIGNVYFPHIIKLYHDRRKEILELTNNPNKDLLRLAYKYWQWPSNKKKNDLLHDFKVTVDELGAGFSKELTQAQYSSLSQLIFTDQDFD